MKRKVVRKNKKRGRVGPPYRMLTDKEAKEEEIYRRQLKEKWSFKPGEHPVDVWRRERQAEEWED